MANAARTGPSRRASTRVVGWLALGCALPLSAIAQRTAAESRPSTASPLGMSDTGMPLGPRELSLRLTSGYGVTERIAGAPAAEQRLQGGLELGATPLAWLGFGLRLDGRLELHADDGRGSHLAGFGDPRVYVRAGHALDAEWSLGAEIVAWLPGRDVPSVVPAATTLDGRLLAGYRPQRARWLLFGGIGARLDNSARAAPAPSHLRIGDRISMGVSDANALLAAVGGRFDVVKRLDLLAELSADVLVGAAAPRFGDSPLRAAVGARWALLDHWSAELTAIVSLSGRPPLGPNEPWVPIEPRVLALLGIRYAWSLESDAGVARQRSIESTTRGRASPGAETSPLATVQGVIVDERGEPLPDVRVSMHAKGGSTFSVITDARGSYRIEGVPSGDAQLEARSVGFATQRWNLAVRPGLPPSAARALEPAAGIGVVRGLIRNFESVPLSAKLRIKSARGKLVQTVASGPDGRVETELPAGAYTISVEAPGYRIHTLSIEVKGDGVSVLNVDMLAE